MIVKPVINVYNIWISGLCACVYLCWHVHQEKSSDGSLSLTVALVRTIQTVSLQDVKEALLPESRSVESLCS